jgi:hypothetical protein
MKCPASAKSSKLFLGNLYQKKLHFFWRSGHSNENVSQNGPFLTQSSHQHVWWEAATWHELLGAYAPVVNWSTVRLTMILSLIKGFKCQQVDFVQAFTMAPLDCPVYIEILARYTGQLVFTGLNHKAKDKTYEIKLFKNMYGWKQAGCNWYNTLTDEFLNVGFKQSAVDKCLFI